MRWPKTQNELIGKRIGRLTVLARSNKSVPGGNITFDCICDCGKSCTTTGSNLRIGKTQSCGCLHKERFTGTRHGKSKTKEYFIWKAMRQRCLNKNDADYKDYGGRGITVCGEWDLFETFFEDIGVIPKGLSLDRIDNNLGYSKENCKLSTAKEQANNKRTNISRREL